MIKYSQLPKPVFKDDVEKSKPLNNLKNVQDVNEGVVKDFVKKVTGSLFNKKFSITPEKANYFKYVFAKALIDSLDLLKFKTSFSKFTYDYKGILNLVQKDLKRLLDDEYKNKTDRDLRYSTILNLQDRYERNTNLLDELYDIVKYVEVYVKTNGEKYFEKRYTTNTLSKDSERNKEILLKFTTDLELIFEPTNKSFIFGSEKKKNKNQLEIIAMKIVEAFKKRGFDLENMVVKFEQDKYEKDYEKTLTTRDSKEVNIPDVIYTDTVTAETAFKEKEPEEHKLSYEKPKVEKPKEEVKEKPKDVVKETPREIPRETQRTSSTYLLPEKDMDIVFDSLKKKFKNIILSRNINVRKKVYNVLIQPMCLQMTEKNPDINLTYKNVLDNLLDDLNKKNTEDTLKRIEAKKDF